MATVESICRSERRIRRLQGYVCIRNDTATEVLATAVEETHIERGTLGGVFLPMHERITQLACCYCSLDT